MKKEIFLFFLLLGILTIAACGVITEPETTPDKETTQEETPTDIFQEDTETVTDIEDIDIPINEEDLQ